MYKFRSKISIFSLIALITLTFGCSNVFAGSAPWVTTGTADIMSASSVTLNGTFSSDSSRTTAWFQLGTDSSFGIFKTVYPGISGNAMWAGVINLQEGATYYFRAVARNTSGITYGSSNSFKMPEALKSGIGSGSSLSSTSGSGTGTQSGGSSVGLSSQSGGQVLGSGTSTGSSTLSGNSGTNGSGLINGISSGISSNGISTDPSKVRPSFASLEYSLEGEGALVFIADSIHPKPGDEFSYTIVYKNDTSDTFRDSKLRVIIPTEVSYIGASIDPLYLGGNIVDFNVGDIEPGARGAVVMITKINENVKSGSNLVFTSVLEYKNKLNVQLSKVSYLTLKIANSNSSLSASVGSVFTSSAILWLMSFVLIISLGLLIARFVMIRRRVSVSVEKNEIKQKMSDFFEGRNIPATFEPVGPAQPLSR